MGIGEGVIVARIAWMTVRMWGAEWRSTKRTMSGLSRMVMSE